MGATTRHSLTRIRDGGRARCWDHLAVEEPLEVLLRQNGDERPWLVTMRTPGRDRDLVAGLLYAEGIVTAWTDIRRIVVGCAQGNGDAGENRTVVELEPGVELNGAGRATLVTSACGVCGRQVIDDLERHPLPPLPAGPTVTAAAITRLPEQLQTAQKGFGRTGGTHAAGWFDRDGTLLRCAEDVGRHNAVDKVVGAALLDRALAAGESLLAVSGRLSWEILHKARRAGFPVVVGLGAPSSLAVELAARCGMTLCGFVRDGGFNVYCGEERVAEG
ncbi:MAG: formate dehydrogenase accessory sulfurtransferase FdhD [Armatimonadetes bacterium]|nr:formate dehydrogenase accessory sulfurtransferase FdhD [Armatimonadota bacterium]